MVVGPFFGHWNLLSCLNANSVIFCFKIATLDIEISVTAIICDIVTLISCIILVYNMLRCLNIYST